MADSTPEIAADTDAAAPVEASAAVIAKPSAPVEEADNELGLSQLPAHTRNLLKVRVPVTVALASQRTSIQEIVELGPGSIVKFAKTCDEPLELTVGDRTIATGEVVKVGDKFGLRIGRLTTAATTG